MSWEELAAIVQDGAQRAADDAARPPTACPNDGEPLITDKAGQLRCRFDGWVWDGRPVTY